MITCWGTSVRSGESTTVEVTSRVARRASPVPLGMVNCMGRSAASARDVGRGDHFEAMLGPSVGCLRMRIAVHTGKVGDV